MILTVAGVALLPHQAEASWLCLLSPSSCIAQAMAGAVMDSFVAGLSELVLRVVSWFLSLIGILLNASIILTLNIKAIYEATPAIKDLWVVIRNLSSIFIIFALLYTSIMTIIGSNVMGGVKKLVGNIILAGLLINFSLFFTKVAIDTSNLVSLQFYRAIVPSSQNATIDSNKIGNVIMNAFSSGGLSDVFMSSLKIPKVYNKRNSIFDTNNAEYFKVIVSTLAGSTLMIVAALSFLAASIMFIIRIVVLLLLMGFSPVYFAGMIFPEIKSKISDEWLKYLTQALIFMPVYLFFMYVAMSFISTMGANSNSFFGQLDNVGPAANKADGTLLPIVGLVLQYTIAFILINIPLYAAIQTGGKSAAWGKSAGKWANKKLQGGVAFGAQHTVGRAAKVAGDKLATSNFAKNNPNLAIIANKNLAKISGAAMGGTKGGYDNRFKAFAKEKSDFAVKRYGLTADHEEDIEERTRTGFIDMADKRIDENQVAINKIRREAEKVGGEAEKSQDKIDESTKKFADLEAEHSEKVNKHGEDTKESETVHSTKVSAQNEVIVKLEKEHTNQTNALGSNSAVTQATKAKLDQARASLVAEETSFRKAKEQAEKNINKMKDDHKNAKESHEKLIEREEKKVKNQKSDLLNLTLNADIAHNKAEKFKEALEAKKKFDEAKKSGVKLSKEEEDKLIKAKEAADEIEIEVKNKQREIVRRESLMQFADDLDKDTNPITRAANKEAANQIRKQAGKSKTQVDSENTLKKLVDELTSKEDRSKEDKPKEDK